MFFTLHANSGYWQGEVNKIDQDKTKFMSDHGLYGFFQMPLGLHNASETSLRAIYVIQSAVEWQLALLYLDGIVIFSRFSCEHIEHLKRALSLLRDKGVTLKLKKCNFFSDKIEYFFHVTRPRQLVAAVIDAGTAESTKVSLGKHQQALPQVVEDSNSLTERAIPTIAEFLQHQAADCYSIKAT